MSRDIDDSSEDVLSEWRGDAEADEPEADDDAPFDSEQHAEVAAWGTAVTGRDDVEEPRSLAVPKTEEVAPEVDEQALESVDGRPEVDEPAPESVDEPLGEPDGTPMTIELSHEHAAGELEIPDGYAVLEGDADGGRRAVGIVVSRFNGAVTSRLLERSLTELETAGVRREAITIMVVPGAFELALAATALAKTRRFACIVALGCVIRGDTPHFDYVASEAASGLQLAALETGVPVSFGVLTLDRVEQAEARFEKGAEAVRSALEMADVFSHLRAAAR